ncbi:MAG: metallophosphoesterase [Kiritimatiellae bacterium]|nr:metallophosphoesterase [Kiritimatiellia bacterium]
MTMQIRRGMPLVSRRWFIGGTAAFGAFGGLRFAQGSVNKTGVAPKIRFGVVSDIHITKIGANEEMAAFGNNLTFRHTLEWFREQGVDAVLIAGDMADKGMGEQLAAVAEAWYAVFPGDRYPDGRPVEKVFVTGNHDWDGFNYGGFAAKAYPDEAERNRHILRKDMAGWWKKVFHEDYEPIYLKTIKGYSFIGCHWDTSAPNGKHVYAFSRLSDFLVSRASAIDPALPFFYAQHPHPKNTCYGPWAWGHDKGFVTKALAERPNAIAFSGHSHYSLTDERSIWQGAFTSVGTSSLRYTGLPYNEFPGEGFENTPCGDGRHWQTDARKMMGRFITPGDCRQGMLWSVYDDCIVVKRREFLSNLDLGDDWVMPLPAAESKPFAFTEHAKKLRAPQFADGAGLKIAQTKTKNRGGKSKDGKVKIPSVAKDSVQITAPASLPDRNARLYCYEFTAESKSGEKKVKRVLAEGYNHAPEHPRAKLPTLCVFAKDELPAGELRFTAVPRNSFGLAGKTFSTEWMTLA